MDCFVALANEDGLGYGLPLTRIRLSSIGPTDHDGVLVSRHIPWKCPARCSQA
jgi:hypothetical protein